MLYEMKSTKDCPTLKTKTINNQAFRRMTIRNKAAYICSMITIEPLSIIYEICTTLTVPAIRTMEFEKSCRVNHGYNNTICEMVLKSTIESIQDENIEIQKSISKMRSWLTPVTTIMPIIMVLFLGSYSDRHKIRKPFLIIPIVGELLAITGCSMCAMFMNEWSLEVLGVIEQVIPSLFGGNTMFIMAVYSYIIDVSTPKMRTIRVGIVQLVTSISSVTVKATSGVVFEHVGYYGVLGIVFVLCVVGLIYGTCIVSEPSPQKDNAKVGISLINDIFNPRHATDTFCMLIKQKRRNKLLNIQIMVFALAVYHGVVSGKFFHVSTYQIKCRK